MIISFILHMKTTMKRLIKNGINFSIFLNKNHLGEITYVIDDQKNKVSKLSLKCSSRGQD